MRRRPTIEDKVRRIADEVGGAIYAGYSGRFMYGDRCWGVTCSRFSVADVERAGARAKFGSARTDDMGRDAIVYWPGLKYEVRLDEYVTTQGDDMTTDEKRARLERVKLIHNARERLRRATNAHGAESAQAVKARGDLAALLALREAAVTATAFESLREVVPVAAAEDAPQTAPDAPAAPAPVDVTPVAVAVMGGAWGRLTADEKALAVAASEPAAAPGKKNGATRPANGAAGTWGRVGTAAEAYKRHIMAGLDNAAARAAVVAELGEAKAGPASYPGWYRAQLRKQGHVPGAVYENSGDRDLHAQVEFTETRRGQRARERYAERYDALDGAPDGDDDR